MPKVGEMSTDSGLEAGQRAGSGPRARLDREPGNEPVKLDKLSDIALEHNLRQFFGINFQGWGTRTELGNE